MFKENDTVAAEKERDKFAEEIVEEVRSDFEKRRKERLLYERQWELNMNFLAGRQYCEISPRGEIEETDDGYFWQNREVFNHIAPIIESRIAKLARVTPIISVRPKSDDEADVSAAAMSEKLIEWVFRRADAVDAARRATAWSEACGTAFYKVVWDNCGGGFLGSVDGKDVYEGEAEIIAVSPFEIFPDDLHTEKLKDCRSIIHAKAVPVSVIREKYGVAVAGEDISIYNLSASGNKDSGESAMNDAAVVIERYERPDGKFPNGRLITVAGDKLLFYGELPYENDENKKRLFPFVKQESIVSAGHFFGTSVIERLIPVQRAYNAVKNRKHEFLNRLTMGVMTVEDGSVDVEDLEEGLPPGKVLVYRQGAKTPEMMKEGAMPPDFNEEEQKLLNEFVAISGVSEVSTSSENANLSSGSALELLVEQDNERLTSNAEIIRNSYLEIARLCLRLYAQFTAGCRAIKYLDEFDRTRVIYADGNAAASDDVYAETENELLYTPSQKKNMIFKLYESGLLSDDDGKLRPATKEKVLSLLGYKDLDYHKGLARLHEEKAQGENERIKKEGLHVDVIDDHEVHIDEHTRYFLSEYEDFSDDEKARLINHIDEHKKSLERLSAGKSDNAEESVPGKNAPV